MIDDKNIGSSFDNFMSNCSTDDLTSVLQAAKDTLQNYLNEAFEDYCNTFITRQSFEEWQKGPYGHNTWKIIQDIDNQIELLEQCKK